MWKPSLHTYRAAVLVLTFIAYTAYHASRKPPSIVKSVLLGNSVEVATGGSGNESAEGWAPFNGPEGKALLGNVDLAFLASYAVGMFFAGHLADRMDLRIFLSGGMIMSSVFVMLFGMAYFWGIHDIRFFYLVMCVGGVIQSGGWPSVVSIMANWFGKGKRGLIMGIWNAHTSVGNILGSVIASMLLPPFCGWGWAFVVPGACLAASGVLVWAFLIPQPSDVPGLGPSYSKVSGKVCAPPFCRRPFCSALFGEAVMEWAL